MGYLSDGFRAYGELTAYPSGKRELQGLSGFRNSEPLLFPQLYFPSQALSTGLFQINIFLVVLFLSENRDQARELVCVRTVYISRGSQGSARVAVRSTMPRVSEFE